LNLRVLLNGFQIVTGLIFCLRKTFMCICIINIFDLVMTFS
jgi:hypothetical protein